MPDKAGVYRFLDKNGTVLYVGKAKNLKTRVSSYFTSGNLLGEKTRVLVSQIEKIKITIVESELEALLLEAFYIKHYQPKYNIRLTDNKSYLRIKITVKDKYPAVLLARREDDDNAIYFGPYPNSAALKMVLKTMRRIFPYVSVAHHPKRICLYHHLGLCPCPQAFEIPHSHPHPNLLPSREKEVSLPRLSRERVGVRERRNGTQSASMLQKDYRKNIRGIIKMLEGGSRQVMKQLERQRDQYSKQEKFEEAAAIQKKINALSLITNPFHKPFEYDVNPNLRQDIRQQEMNELMETLNKAGYHLKKLERIECYDISNTQGTHATASMVVLTNGEIDKSQYRRFKIRRDWEKKTSLQGSISRGRQSNPMKPNDFAMMKEVLQRRFRHDEWHWPDLLVVDGGKGQVSSARKAFAELGIDIPLIGLAKREETIVVPVLAPKQDDSGVVVSTPPRKRYTVSGKRFNAYPESDLSFLEISLPKNSPGLHLIMRIRDEAHRFAITYHRKLRSKYFIN